LRAEIERCLHRREQFLLGIRVGHFPILRGQRVGKNRAQVEIGLGDVRNDFPERSLLRRGR
jgi:hypothetical protein